MKKYLIIAVGMMLAGQALYAVQVKDITNALNTNAEKYKSVLDFKIPTEQRNQPLEVWKKTFDLIKAFVIDKSKILGIKDSDLINPLNKIEKMNNDLMTINKQPTRITHYDQLCQLKKLLETAVPQKNLDNAITEISQVKFTLSSKKEAQVVLINLGKKLNEILAATHAMIQSNINKYGVNCLPSQSTPQAAKPSPSAPQPKPVPTSPTVQQFTVTPKMQKFLNDQLKNNDITRNIRLSRTAVEAENAVMQELKPLLNNFRSKFQSELSNFTRDSIIMSTAETIVQIIVNQVKTSGMIQLLNDQENIILKRAIIKAAWEVFPQ